MLKTRIQALKQIFDVCKKWGGVAGPRLR